MSLQQLKSYREKNPLITTLVLLNLFVGIGWLGLLGYRWLEARRLCAAQTEQSIRLSMRDGGFSREDAVRIHEISLWAERQRALPDDDVAYIVSHLDAPSPEGRDSLFTKTSLIRAVLDAKNLSAGQRSLVTPAIVRFLEKEPTTPYEAPAYLAIRALQADKSPSASEEFKRLYRLAGPRRKEAFDDAIKRKAGIKVPPHP